jgi:AraC-like DNA-binding protein
LKKHHSIDTRDYNQIIEALAVTFIQARHIKWLQSLTIENFHDVDNYIILLNHGQIICAQKEEEHTVTAGDILFIPGGQPVTITYGDGSHPVTLNNSYLTPSRCKYFQAIQKPAFTAQFDNFSYATFDAKVFNTIDLFAFLRIPAFVIKDNEPLSNVLKNIFIESSAEAAGSSRMVKANTEQLIVELVRHLIAKNLFVENIATNSTAFKDPRLMGIFDYIKENLHGDLSNRMLATVAHVSEDYAGQYFKMLTGINPQDYIENQRMGWAVKLLRTTQKSVSDIGKEVGFKDTAYFCRRFKMKFGIPAGKMRNRVHILSG